MSIEVEIKFSIDSGSLESPAFLKLLTQWLRGTPQIKRVFSDYYDTPQFDLVGAGLSLRMRQVGENWLQTLKHSGNKTAGLSVREELETPLAGPAFDWEAFAGSPFEAVIRSVSGCVSPVFTTDFERTTYLLEPELGTLVEMVVDSGEVRAGSRREPIQEIELELKSGSLVKMLAAARQLLEVAPLRLENRSKAARGYLLSGHWIQKSEISATEGKPWEWKYFPGLETLLRQSMNRLQELAKTIVCKPEFEELEETSDLLAGMGICIGSFLAQLPQVSRPLVADGLLGFRDELEEALDWFRVDFLVLSPLRAQVASPVYIDRLLADADIRRQEALTRLRELFGSVRFSRMLLDLLMWIESGPWQGSEPDQSGSSGFRPLKDWVADSFEACLESLDDFIPTPSFSSIEALDEAVSDFLHGLRFFLPLFPDPDIKSQLSRDWPLAHHAALTAEGSKAHQILVLRSLERCLNAWQASSRCSELMALVGFLQFVLEKQDLQEKLVLFRGWLLDEMEQLWSSLSELRPFWMTTA